MNSSFSCLYLQDICHSVLLSDRYAIKNLRMFLWLMHFIAHSMFCQCLRFQITASGSKTVFCIVLCLIVFKSIEACSKAPLQKIENLGKSKSTLLTLSEPPKVKMVRKSTRGTNIESNQDSEGKVLLLELIWEVVLTENFPIFTNIFRTLRHVEMA